MTKIYKRPDDDGLEVHPKDTTPAGLPDAHVAEYGKTPISYKKAFQLAIPAVIHQEDGETPRAIVKETAESEKHSLSEAELDRKMTKLVDEGSFELLPVGESDENGDDPRKNWIFSVNVDTGSDHGFWASVDRNTGEVSVTGFN
ncbi:hypothetical protein [Microvirga massiliensis]|uniref:hypothetical protein n=1 Tax=Microvirga massiliensis TaxID=1033741 RepID=UPI0011C86DC5|nr:hypothetical protein [Microvirga massiliensis]